MNPSDCRYSKEHEWVRLEPDGKAAVGVTSYAQGQLGDIVFVYFPEVGTKVEQFKMFGEVESPKAVSEIYAPLSGEIVEINEALLEKPELVNKESYGGGWLIRLIPSDLSELEKLMTAESYEKMLSQLQESA